MGSKPAESYRLRKGGRGGKRKEKKKKETA